jgi:hypothetical protein
MGPALSHFHAFSMLGHCTARRAAMRIAGLILLGLLLVSMSTNVAFSNDVTVSPGKYDLTLGTGFPTFVPVKLSYPNSSILTNSVGDLLFTVDLTKAGNYSGVSIYVPPDFSGLTIGKAWTSFTNNYGNISLSRLSSSDRIGPNWWEITVRHLHLTTDPYQANPANSTFLVNKTQYVRLFQVTSPSTAGRYFFKTFINGTSPCPDEGATCFPTIVVKGSRDPAYISGVLRDLGDRNVSRAGQPVYLPNATGAQVLATGIDYLGNPASAQAFINSTAKGNYTLFGVAPGTYNITAYAAGYIPTNRPTTVSVSPAQSLEGVDIYLSESVNITGTVLSESYLGTQNRVPWGTIQGFGGKATPRAITIKVLNLDGTVAASTPAPYGISTSTIPTTFTFDFAIQHEVGFDGRIPQVYANYTSGLRSGDYLLYAFVTSYVQLAEVRLHVGNETTQTRSVIPLLRAGLFNVTVHFRNQTSSKGEDHIPIDSTLTLSAYDQRGVLRAQNVTFVKAGAHSATVELQGFSSSRSFGTASLFSQNYGLLPGTYQIIARVTSSPSYAGSSNVGIRDFYYQTDNVQATMGLGSNVSLSFSVYKAGGIDITVYSIDDQLPLVPRDWGHPGAAINVFLVNSEGLSYQASPGKNATQSPSSYAYNFSYVGLQTDNYAIIVQTLGYTQREIPLLNVVLGGNSDVSVWMIKDPVINLTIFFRDEGLLSNINSSLPFAQPINHIAGTPMRVEVFDDRGNFVAANASYVPNLGYVPHTHYGYPVGYANFTLAGFDSYSGNPRLIWSGFYDTTDGASQTAGGLFLYPWHNSPREFTIRVWVEGYYQLTPLRLTVPATGGVSAAVQMDRATRIIGSVAGPDFFDTARPLSWANVTLEPNNYTLTRIIDVRPGDYSTSSLDGSFQVWVPEGSYGVGASLAGYSTYSTRISAPSGSELSLQIWLDNYQASIIANALASSDNTRLIQVAGDTTPNGKRLDIGWDFNQTS